MLLKSPAFASCLALCLAIAATPASAQQQSAETAAKEPNASVSPNGLVYRSLQDGTGVSPKPGDRVKVHYRGTLPDGTEFDSSYKRNAPAEFALDRVIPCWTEGVARMKVGGKAKLTCPPAMAYGARGTPGGPVPPNATLFFEVELLGVTAR